MRTDAISMKRIRDGTGYYVIEGGTRRNYSFDTLARLALTHDSPAQRKELKKLLRIVTEMPKRSRPVGQVLFLSPFTRMPVSTRDIINVRTNRKKNAVRIISKAWH
jgi:hypothetical protein